MKIEIGRKVRFHGAYMHATDGMIVAIHGDPNQPIRPALGGFFVVVRNNDCSIDVILDNGRHSKNINVQGLGRPGIGYTLMDEVYPADRVPAMYELADEAEAHTINDEMIKAANRLKVEAARVIDKAPIFYYNGIKDAKGEKLQKCYYSDGAYNNYPKGTIGIGARDYNRFSPLISECFNVKNDSDSQSDYFCNDRIYVLPVHPLYPQVLAALNASQANFNNRMEKRAAKRA